MTPRLIPTFLRTLLLANLLLVLNACAADNYAQRPEVQAFIAQMQTQDGFDADELSRLFATASHEDKAIAYIQPPSTPNVRSWQRYRSRYLDRIRIEGGARFWTENAAALAQAAQTYGVPEEIIVAIIGVETIYGRITGNFQTFSTLTTLAFDYPPRAELFRRELRELLLLAREQKRSPLDYYGSYAGALGIPQFLPSSYRQYAIGINGDAYADIVNEPKDAIASVAHFLQQHGWKAGGRIALPAHVKDESAIAPLLAAGIAPQFDLAALESKGVSADYPIQEEEPAALIDLITPGQNTEYWLGYNNFYVITRYNRSSFYAMAVYELSRALKLQHDAQQLAPTNIQSAEPVKHQP